MSDFKLKGIFPALITPFREDEKIDEEAFRGLIRKVLPHVDGVVPCGTTGEFIYLSMDEKKRLYEIAVEETPDDKYVIAGTGACSTREAIQLTALAEKAGADAALVVSPYFLDQGDKGQYEHYHQIAKSTHLPIIMYNIPQCTGRPLSRRVIEDLSKLDNIVGLKDSSGDLTYTMEILEHVKNNINVVIGHDEVVMPALSGGCKGMILASAQVFPDIWREVFNAVKEGDLQGGRTGQMKVQKLARIFCRYGGAVPVKAALRMLGIPVGRARRPLMEGGVILHEDREEIRVELEKLGKIKNDNKPSQLPSTHIEQRFEDLNITSEDIAREALPSGEGRAGEGSEMVFVELVGGSKKGIMGDAFAIQFTHPRHGYEALTTILEPNLSVRPSTLIVPGFKLKNLRQANMIYGPVQSSAARAIVDNIEKGVIPEELLNEHVIIARTYISPSALDRQKLYDNNYLAFDRALGNAYNNRRWD